MTLVLLLLVLCLFSACAGEDYPALRSGDLVFRQDADEDFSDAISASTGGGYTHVGIIERTEEGLFVIEALPSEGVCRHPFAAFLTPEGAKKPAQVDAYRLRIPCDPEAVLSRAHRLLGRPYDFFFEPGEDALYCSELIYYCYRDERGKPLFSSRPMSFGDEGGILPYWESYYARAGRPVPQGEEGTNPNDLAHETILQAIPF